jgi:hypothetical protein
VKRILIALALTLMLSAVTFGQSQVKDIYDTINLGVTANKDSSIMYFPKAFSYGKPVLDGYISVNIQPDTVLAAPTGEDSLSVWCRKLQKNEAGTYVMDQVDSVLCVANLDWARGKTYSYEITSELGPCHGLVVFAKYTSTTAADSLTCPIWLTVQ